MTFQILYQCYKQIIYITNNKYNYVKEQRNAVTKMIQNNACRRPKVIDYKYSQGGEIYV